MTQDVRIALTGLFTNVNQLSAPEGSMRYCSNAVIDQIGVVECRRGQRKASQVAPQDMARIFNYNGETWAFSKRVESNGADLFKRNSETVWSGIYGTYPVTYDRSIVSIGGNAYFTSDAGVHKITPLTTESTGAVTIGVPTCPAGAAVVSAGGSFLANNYSTVYRVVLGYREGTKLYLGTPSGRFGVSNTAGAARDVDLTIPLPSGLTTKYFIQIYRAYQLETPATGAVPLTDDLLLTDERPITSTAISNGFIQLTDTTKDDSLGALLYTSSSQEGPDAANDPPPIAYCLSVYKNRLFYGDVKQPGTLNIRLADRLSVGQTLTIGTEIYTASVAEGTGSSTNFQFFNTADQIRDIENTCLSLCRRINTTSSLVYAYYTSPPQYFGDPGQITLVAKWTTGASTRAIYSSNNNVWVPNLPTDATVETPAQLSINQFEESPGVVMFSKFQEYEAVPYLNSLTVGNKTSRVLALAALNEALVVFKEDGVFLIVGTDESNFTIQVVSRDSVLYARRSVTVLGNNAYGLLQDGLYEFSETGVFRNISLPVADKILQYSLNNLEVVFSIANPGDRKLIYFCSDNIGSANRAYVYSQVYDVWTMWEMVRVDGYEYNRRLYFADRNFVYEERKTGTIADYTESSDEVTITNIISDRLYFGSVASFVSGCVITQGSRFAYVSSVNLSENYVSVTNANYFTTGVATLNQPIKWEASFNLLMNGNPGVMKHFRETTVSMRDAQFYEMGISYSGSFDAERFPYYYTQFPQNIGWGDFAWGNEEWGGIGYNYQFAFRSAVTEKHTRSLWLNINLICRSARSRPAVSGLSVIFNLMSERFPNAQSY
jgi:hypothetical protein